jgi:hypothetical protein
MNIGKITHPTNRCPSTTDSTNIKEGVCSDFVRVAIINTNKLPAIQSKKKQTSIPTSISMAGDESRFGVIEMFIIVEFVVDAIFVPLLHQSIFCCGDDHRKVNHSGKKENWFLLMNVTKYCVESSEIHQKLNLIPVDLYSKDFRVCDARGSLPMTYVEHMRRPTSNIPKAPPWASTI